MGVPTKDPTKTPAILAGKEAELDDDFRLLAPGSVLEMFEVFGVLGVFGVSLNAGTQTGTIAILTHAINRVLTGIFAMKMSAFSIGTTIILSPHDKCIGSL